MPAPETKREQWVTVEWFDTVTGEWRDLGEASSVTKAAQRIAGLHAADSGESNSHGERHGSCGELQRYRIVEFTATEIPNYAERA